MQKRLCSILLRLEAGVGVRLTTGEVSQNVLIAHGPWLKCAMPKNPVGQMTLAFPNRTRSYDTKRRGVHFQGYDGMFEVPFFVVGDALTDDRPQVDAETQYLAAFDSSRDSIYDVAREIYSNGRKGIYVLTAADFR